MKITYVTAHSFIEFFALCTLRIEYHSAFVWGMTSPFVQNDILGKEDNIWRGYMLGILYCLIILEEYP